MLLKLYTANGDVRIFEGIQDISVHLGRYTPPPLYISGGNTYMDGKPRFHEEF